MSQWQGHPLTSWCRCALLCGSFPHVVTPVQQLLCSCRCTDIWLQFLLLIKLPLSINLESVIKGVAKYSSGRVHEYRIVQLLTRGFICGKLILGVCSLYSASAAPVSHCHRPLNKPASALVCLSFCRYLKALLRQLETAAGRGSGPVLSQVATATKACSWPVWQWPGHCLVPCALQRVPWVSHLC